MFHLESGIRGYCRTFPSFFDVANGSYIYSDNGDAYLDCLSGCGSPITANDNEGHRDMILMGFHYWRRDHYRYDWKDSIYDPTNPDHR